MSGMEDYFDTSWVFEKGKFDISKLLCIRVSKELDLIFSSRASFLAFMLDELCITNYTTSTDNKSCVTTDFFNSKAQSFLNFSK